MDHGNSMQKYVARVFSLARVDLRLEVTFGNDGIDEGIEHGIRHGTVYG